MADLGFAKSNGDSKITKITVNMGVGEAVGDKKVLEAAVGDLEKLLVKSCYHQGAQIHCGIQNP